MTYTTLSHRIPLALAGAGVILSLVSVLPFGARADLLTRQLEQGMTGADVSTLQTFLASDITIYPQGLVTGFFGPLTFSAVSNFQSANGISRVGRVGPITLAAINKLLGGGVVTTGDWSAPIITALNISTSATSATVTWTTNENTLSRLYYDVTSIGMAEDRNGSSRDTVSVTGTAKETATPGFRTQHTVSLPNLQPNMTYHYVIHSTDQSGNVSVTWPTTFRTSE